VRPPRFLIAVLVATACAPHGVAPGVGEGEGEGAAGEGEGEGEGEGAAGEGEGAAGEGEGEGAACALPCDHGVCRGDGCHCDPGFHAALDNRSCVDDVDTPCAGISCGDHGNCQVNPFLGASSCVCDAGFTAYGFGCVDSRTLACDDGAGGSEPRGSSRCDPTDTYLEVCGDGDGDGLMEWIYGADCASGGSCASTCLGVGCDVQPCPAGTVCVPEAHEQPLNVCVPSCDCGNCGNCGADNSDGRWNDEQEYCGAAPNTSPATTKCTLPCPSAGDGCIPYDPPICWPIEGCFSG
jgi:hypothetical protein